MKRLSRTEGGWEKERTRDRWKSKEDDGMHMEKGGKEKERIRGR